MLLLAKIIILNRIGITLVTSIPSINAKGRMFYTSKWDID
jgi:hypothetical protein